MSIDLQGRASGTPRTVERSRKAIPNKPSSTEHPPEPLSGVLGLTIFRAVLDALSTPIFIVEEGRQIAFANSAARAMLSQAKHVRQAASRLQTTRVGPSGEALTDALERAFRQGLTPEPKGVGVPLVSSDGEPAAAYVLPMLGVDVSGAADRAYATIFIGHRSNRVPMAIEVLSSIFGLTQSEARVAVLIAKGENPAGIVDALGVSINTVRTQLAGAFSKMGVASQSALAAMVNELMPPVGNLADPC
jgi:DNA-binding CsgD family transcriptional regulator